MMVRVGAVECNMSPHKDRSPRYHSKYDIHFMVRSFLEHKDTSYHQNYKSASVCVCLTECL